MAAPLHTPRVNNNDDVVRLIRVVVKPGDSVKAGDLVAEVETDKASFTVEADQPGFVLAVLPQLNDLIDVGSVLLWLGTTPDEKIPESTDSSRVDVAPAEPTVKAAQLMTRYGLKPADVPSSGPRLSAKDVEEHIKARRLLPVDRPGQRDETTGGGPAVPGKAQALTPEERGMLRTVLWQRQQAVPGYVEIQYDPRPWERAAVAYQQHERLLMNPVLSLMAYRLARIAGADPRYNSTIVDEQRYVYDTVNLGFTVQAETTLYLTVIEDAARLECREFVNRLGQLQRSAMAHRLRPHEASGATIAFSSMARWDVTRHIPVLPPFTCLILAHAGISEGRGTLGATYDHRVLTGYDALAALKTVSQPEDLL
jgi:pyruvate/2-oxoglutarate dehydrogenase complex dihydrolipoamide acyltransferase (E2) component